MIAPAPATSPTIIWGSMGSGEFRGEFRGQHTELMKRASSYICFRRNISKARRQPARRAKGSEVVFGPRNRLPTPLLPPISELRNTTISLLGTLVFWFTTCSQLSIRKNDMLQFSLKRLFIAITVDAMLFGIMPCRDVIPAMWTGAMCLGLTGLVLLSTRQNMGIIAWSIVSCLAGAAIGGALSASTPPEFLVPGLVIGWAFGLVVRRVSKAGGGKDGSKMANSKGPSSLDT